MRDFGANLPTRQERILWLCVLLDRILGLNHFEHVRMLLSGMPSVVHAPALREACLPLANLRLMNLSMDTPGGVDRAIDDYVNLHATRAPRASTRSTCGPKPLLPQTASARTCWTGSSPSFAPPLPTNQP